MDVMGFRVTVRKKEICSRSGAYRAQRFKGEWFKVWFRVWFRVLMDKWEVSLYDGFTRFWIGL